MYETINRHLKKIKNPPKLINNVHKQRLTIKNWTKKITLDSAICHSNAYTVVKWYGSNAWL